MKRARPCCFLFLLLVCTILAGCTASVPEAAYFFVSNTYTYKESGSL